MAFLLSPRKLLGAIENFATTWALRIFIVVMAIFVIDAVATYVLKVIILDQSFTAVSDMFLPGLLGGIITKLITIFFDSIILGFTFIGMLLTFIVPGLGITPADFFELAMIIFMEFLSLIFEDFLGFIGNYFNSFEPARVFDSVTTYLLEALQNLTGVPVLDLYVSGVRPFVEFWGTALGLISQSPNLPHQFALNIAFLVTSFVFGGTSFWFIDTAMAAFHEHGSPLYGDTENPIRQEDFVRIDTVSHGTKETSSDTKYKRFTSYEAKARWLEIWGGSELRPAHDETKLRVVWKIHETTGIKYPSLESYTIHVAEQPYFDEDQKQKILDRIKDKAYPFIGRIKKTATYTIDWRHRKPPS